MKSYGPCLKVHKEFKFFIVTSASIFFAEWTLYNLLLPHDFQSPYFVLTAVLVPSDTSLIDMTNEPSSEEQLTRGRGYRAFQPKRLTLK